MSRRVLMGMSKPTPHQQHKNAHACVCVGIEQKDTAVAAAVGPISIGFAEWEDRPVMSLNLVLKKHLGRTSRTNLTDRQTDRQTNKQTDVRTTEPPRPPSVFVRLVVTVVIVVAIMV